MRRLIGIAIATAAGVLTGLARAEGAAPSVATSQPADPNAAFDADLNKYKGVPQASYQTATAHAYSETVVPRVIDRAGLDDATKAKALAVHDAWRAKMNPRNELRYKKLTALRNASAAEQDAAKKAGLQAQIDSLRWPTQGDNFSAVKAELRGVLSEEQLAKLEAVARELVNGALDQFMAQMIALYPDLTDEQMKRTNDLIKSIKDETAKLAPGDLSGTTLIRARFQQTFRNQILTEAQRKIERIRE